MQFFCSGYIYLMRWCRNCSVTKHAHAMVSIHKHASEIIEITFIIVILYNVFTHYIMS